MAKPTLNASFDATNLPADYKALWDKALAVIPLWEGSGSTVTDLKSGAVGTLEGNAAWGSDAEGVFIDMPDVNATDHIDFSGTALGGLTLDNLTMVVVCRPSAGEGSQDDGYLVALGPYGAANVKFSLAVADDAGYVGYPRMNYAGINAFRDLDVSDNTVRVIGGRWDGSTGDLDAYAGGALSLTQVDSGVTAPITISDNSVYLFNYPGNTEQFRGDGFAVYLFEAVLTPTELGLIDADPYGLFREDGSGGTISGTLSIDGSGAASSGTMYAVNVGSGAVSTDAVDGSGNFQFNGLAAGTYRVWGETTVGGNVYTTQTQIVTVT